MKLKCFFFFFISEMNTSKIMSSNKKKKIIKKVNLILYSRYFCEFKQKKKTIYSIWRILKWEVIKLVFTLLWGGFHCYPQRRSTWEEKKKREYIWAKGQDRRRRSYFFFRGNGISLIFKGFPSYGEKCKGWR